MRRSSLTAAALSGAGSATARAGRTVAAREAGLVLGLLILTPVFVDDLDAAPGRAVPAVTKAVFGAPIPDALKGELATELLTAYRKTPEGRLPDLDPAFARVRAHASASTATQLTALQNGLESTIERAVTRSFRRSLLYCAVFALLVLPVLALRLTHVPRQRLGATEMSAPRSS